MQTGSWPGSRSGCPPKGLIRCRSCIAGWARPLGWGWPAGTGDAGRRRAEPASRGTKTGLQPLIRLVTGQPCEVVERFQWEDGIRSDGEREDCKRLYSGGRSGVTLLFPAGTSSEKLSTLKAVLDDFIPLGVPYTVVRREETVAMDGHSYLDGGAEIADPPPAELDGPEDSEWILE